MSHDVRQTFLDAARAASALVGDPAVAAAWDEPSALSRMTVGDLTAHLARAGVLVQTYLDAPGGGGAAVDAPGYFLTFGDPADVDSALSEGVRKRARDGAGQGPAAVSAGMAETVEALADLLPGLPSDRRITVKDGIVMSLDEYLKTRLVELTVHSDDLLASVPGAGGGGAERDAGEGSAGEGSAGEGSAGEGSAGVDGAGVPEQARAVAVDVLVTIALRRHGTAAVLRALTRRERDAVEALRVL